MAVVSTQSGLIATLEAGGNALAPSRNIGGYIEGEVATATKASGDSTLSYYRMLRVKSSWRIAQLQFLTAAWGAGGAIDIGIADLPAAGGAIVSAQVFAAGISVQSAFTQWYDVTALAGAPADVTKQLWERLGLTSDPNKQYDIVVKATNIGAAQAAAFALQVKYQR